MVLRNNTHPPMKRSDYQARAAVCLLALTASTLSAQVAPAPDVQPASAKEEVLTLSPFQVTTTQDRGYRAGNSVSATRIDTPIKDLPFSINAFTEEFIDDIGARDLYDIVQYAPGVTTVGREFTAGNAVYNIRGFDQSPQHNGFVGESYVDAATIERVEVVKGPSSLLYGQVAPGGTVNYITKRPQTRSFAKLSAAAGSHDYWRASLDLNRPLVGDTLLLRFNGSWENDIEYYRDSRSRTSVLAPVITWRISDKVALTTDYQHFERREAAPAAVRQLTSRIVPPLPASGILSSASALQQPSGEDRGFLGFYPGLPRRFNASANSDRRFTVFDSVNAELTVKLAESWDARANFNWNRNGVRYQGTGLNQASVTVPARFFTDGLPPSTTNDARYRTAAARFSDAILRDPRAALEAPQAQLQRSLRLDERFNNGKTVQVELAGKLGLGGVEWKPLFGAYYQDSNEIIRTAASSAAQNFPPWNLYNPATWNADTANPADLPLSLSAHNRTVARNSAAYAVVSASLLDDRFSVVGGLRYNQATGSVDDFRNANNNIAKQESTRTTPQIGVGWKLRPDLMLYGSYSEAFVRNTATLQIANIPSGPAAPTTAEGFEIGLKSDLFSGRVSSTIAYYAIEQQDRLVNFNTNPAGVTLVNRIQGTLDRSEGVEVEITWSPLDNWQVYLSGVVQDVVVERTPAGTDYLLGSHPEGSAEKLFNLWTRYSLTGDALKGLWIGAGFNYNGEKAQRVNNPALFIPDYTLWNAALGYEWKQGGRPMTATLNWHNITDEDYNPAGFLRGSPGRVVLEVTTRF